MYIYVYIYLYLSIYLSIYITVYISLRIFSYFKGSNPMDTHAQHLDCFPITEPCGEWKEGGVR